ncbi:MAG: hypothetical protein QM496_13870 [Verrucomicrobiota bacterium]
MAESDQNNKLPTSFALEGDENLTDRQKVRRQTVGSFNHKLAYYCKKFGKLLADGSTRALDRKTVERWVKRGRESCDAGDLPPLDHPELMAEWYRRTMKTKVPEVLATFEFKNEEGAAEKGGEVIDVEGVSRAMLQKALKMADDAGLGFEAALERARLAERFAYTQWQVMLLEPENHLDTAISKRKKAWEEAAGVLLRAEEKAEKIMDRSAEWARWDEVERHEAEKLAILAHGIRSLLTRVATKNPFPPGLFNEMNRAFSAEVDVLFSSLSAGNYKPVLELEGE